MNHKKVLILCSFGALFEYYDFAIFALLMPLFKIIFFSGGNPLFDSIKVFAIFASGYVARLVGGIWYSHQSDKYGRKKPFLQTLLLMAIPTILIGFLPVFSQIGVLAPLLLFMLRIIQGISMGGESPSAITIVFETSKEKYKTTTIGIIMGSFVLGSFVGSLLISGLTFFQSEKTFQLWGWRIPFIIGGILCLIGAMLRRNLNETPEFLEAKQKQKNISIPFFTLIQKYRLQVMKCIVIGIPTAVSFMYYLLVLNNFLEPYYKVTLKNLIYLTSVCLVTNAFMTGLCGFLADKWNYKIMYIFGICCIGIWALVSHFIFLSSNIYYISASVFIMSICIGVPLGSLFHLILSMFPAEVRVSGIAVVLNIVNGLIVGNIPLLFSFLMKTTGLIYLPSLLISFFCILSIIIMIKFIHKET